MAGVEGFQLDEVRVGDVVTFQLESGKSPVATHRVVGEGRAGDGERVLVHGAAGGIGTSALRLAPVLGASRVIAVVSSEEKGQIATAAGATDVLLADGKVQAVGALIGPVMKATKGQADAGRVRELILEKLGVS